MVLARHADSTSSSQNTVRSVCAPRRPEVRARPQSAWARLAASADLVMKAASSRRLMKLHRPFDEVYLVHPLASAGELDCGGIPGVRSVTVG